MRESFIFYKSFYESIKELPDNNKIEIYEAIFEKEFHDVDIELKGISKSIYTLILPQLEANNKRYINGKKGGRPKIENQIETKIKPNNNQIITKAKPNVNVNVNDNVNNNNNKKENKKEKYGIYGRVKLTIDEYLKLVNDFGEDFIKKQIDLLDEYVEGNNNKNKYTNFNLVLRKSIRENWFKQRKEEKGNNVFLDIMKDEYGR